MGKNSIQIKVIDINNQFRSKYITIQKKLPKVFLSEFRRIVVIDPLTNNGLKDETYLFFQKTLLNYFYKWQRFQLIPGKKLSINHIFDSINNTNRQNESNLLFSGTINCKDKWIEISASITDISTSEKILIKDIYDEFDQLSKSIIQTKTNELFNKLKISLPVINARIRKSFTDKLQVNLQGNNIQLNWPIIIYRETCNDPIRGADSKILWHSYIDENFENGVFSIKAHKDSNINDEAEWMITK